MISTLTKHYKIWQKKKILRIIYHQWYKNILNDLSSVSGKTLEIGSGSGNLKEYKSDIISSDIESNPLLDMCFDAHKIPFQNSSLSNIVMIDVLHHLQNPVLFLHETIRVLKNGGRLIMVEPYPSLFSLFIYKRFHTEPFLFNINYFKCDHLTEKGRKKKPWDSNQAIPYLLFFKFQRQLEKTHQYKMKILKKRRMSFLLYPLSGGFEHKSLIPNIAIPFFQLIEKLLIPLQSLLAFRCYIVLEKTDNHYV